MAEPNKIVRLAHQQGSDVPELLEQLLDLNGHDATKVARHIGVSQSSVTTALKRHGFKRQQRYMRQNGGAA